MQQAHARRGNDAAALVLALTCEHLGHQHSWLIPSHRLGKEEAGMDTQILIQTV